MRYGRITYIKFSEFPNKIISNKTDLLIYYSHKKICNLPIDFERSNVKSRLASFGNLAGYQGPSSRPVATDDTTKEVSDDDLSRCARTAAAGRQEPLKLNRFELLPFPSFSLEAGR